MKAPLLQTENPTIRLVEPDVERDAQLSVQWLNGEVGRLTMRSMGNTEEAINEMLPTSTGREANRVEDFLKREDQLNWMIECEGKVVGSVWVDLENSKDVPGPSVHIMIGDPDARGKGIGSTTLSTVIDYLLEQGHETIYSRHLTANQEADHLLKSVGFTDLGEPYISDTLEFQNLVRAYGK